MWRGDKRPLKRGKVGTCVLHQYQRRWCVRRRCHRRDVVLHVQLCIEFTGQRTVVHVKSQLCPG